MKHAVLTLILAAGCLVPTAIAGAAHATFQSNPDLVRDAAPMDRRSMAEQLDLRKVVMAIVLYCVDNDGRYPESLEQLKPHLDPEFKPRRPIVLLQPAENEAKVKDPANTILCYSLSANGRHAHVAYCDTAVERLLLADFEKKLREQTGSGPEAPEKP